MSLSIFNRDSETLSPSSNTLPDVPPTYSQPKPRSDTPPSSPPTSTPPNYALAPPSPTYNPTARPATTDTLPPYATPETIPALPLFLANTRIYWALQPTTPMYSLPTTLSGGDRISLERVTHSTRLSTSSASASPPQPKERHVSLYSIQRTPFTTNLEIRGQRASTFNGVGQMSFHMRLFGRSYWGVFFKGAGISIKQQKGLWKLSTGQVLAEEGNFSAAPSEDDAGKLFLEIKAGVEEKMRDLVVACWLGKVWMERPKVRIGDVTRHGRRKFEMSPFNFVAEI
ncbi:MAG: hypothetical protein M1824_003986 [Vezdaea acicularis]|nr:MAG: hypothetical protein M1824_003986 [Vezdaea acicularis]